VPQESDDVVLGDKMGGGGQGGTPEVRRCVTSANENSYWSLQTPPTDAEVCGFRNESISELTRGCLVGPQGCNGGNRTKWRCVR
jgi:hypothetical protein